MTVTNSTLSGNSSLIDGGAIISQGQFTVTDSTISGNIAASGAGIYYSNPGTNTLDGTIVAGNIGGDLTGAFSGTHNLIGDGSGDLGETDNILGTTASPINPELGLLTNNGGPTQTMAPSTASPAIGAGGSFDDASGNPITTDQRGLPRPAAVLDIGAFVIEGITSSPPTDPLDVNTSAAAVIDLPFSDANGSVTETATVNWGDGTPTDAAVDIPTGGTPTVNAAHTYSQPGEFSATVAITDSDGFSETLSVPFIAAPRGAVASAMVSTLSDLTSSSTPGIVDQSIFNSAETALNPSLFTDGYNFSCVAAPSVGYAENATLISPLFVVEAAHYPAENVTFISPNGTIYHDSLMEVDGVVQAEPIDGTDLYLGELSSAVPTPSDPMGLSAPYLITPAALLPAPSDYSDYLHPGTDPVPVVRASQFGQLSVSEWNGGNGLAAVTQGSLAPWALEYGSSGATYDSAPDGDSGNGVFALIDGETVCLGSLYGPTEFDDIASHLSSVQSAMNSYVSDSASGLNIVSFSGVTPLAARGVTRLFAYAA
jgi:hypothetical protein